MKKVTVEVQCSSLSNCDDADLVEAHVAAINHNFSELAKIEGFPSRHIQIGNTIFASLQDNGVVTVYPPVAKKLPRKPKSRVSAALTKLRKRIYRKK